MWELPVLGVILREIDPRRDSQWLKLLHSQSASTSFFHYLSDPFFDPKNFSYKFLKMHKVSSQKDICFTRLSHPLILSCQTFAEPLPTLISSPVMFRFGVWKRRRRLLRSVRVKRLQLSWEFRKVSKFAVGLKARVREKSGRERINALQEQHR